jgi:uncharacterized protein (DUF1697 family)
MTTHIALLRAVNLGGRTKVSMAELRKRLEEAGYADVRTLLQSGNVVFCGGKGDPEKAIAGIIEKHFGYATDVFVRTAAEWKKIIAANPFPDEAENDPGHLVVMALGKAPAKPALEALRAAIKGPETIAAKGPQLYVTYPAGIGRSKLTPAVIEAKLGTRGTGRNWNTVLKLAAVAATD